MKVVTLINLGAATRIVHTASHRPVVIETGRRTEPIEIDDRVHDLLRRGQHRDTLLIVDEDFEIPQRVRDALDLMTRLDDGVDSELIRTYGKIFGREESSRRPSRPAMMRRLSDLTREFCRSVSGPETKRQTGRKTTSSSSVASARSAKTSQPPAPVVRPNRRRR